MTADHADVGHELHPPVGDDHQVTGQLLSTLDVHDGIRRHRFLRHCDSSVLR